MNLKKRNDGRRFAGTWKLGVPIYEEARVFVKRRLQLRDLKKKHFQLQHARTTKLEMC